MNPYKNLRVDELYTELVSHIDMCGADIKNPRTGKVCKTIPNYMMEYDLRDSFPLLRLKHTSLKNIAVELEFFIKGLTDKKWLQERGCHIWDEWANPKLVSFIQWNEMNNNNPTPIKDIYDLGPIYGHQWRGAGVNKKDQLKYIIDSLKMESNNRRLLVNAWNVDDLDEMALPPCHFAFKVMSDGEFLDLTWFQRSTDVGLGLPYNIASYGLLLTLLAKETELKPRKLCGMLTDVHIYEDHFDLLLEHLQRNAIHMNALNQIPVKLIIPDDNWNGIFNWEYNQFTLENYNSFGKLKLEVAI